MISFGVEVFSEVISVTFRDDRSDGAADGDEVIVKGGSKDLVGTGESVFNGTRTGSTVNVSAG